jgi:hypothetical protein
MISLGVNRFHIAILTNNCPLCDGYLHVGGSSAKWTIFTWQTHPPVSRSNAPVRNLQVLYLLKLFGVIGNEGRAKRESVRPYQHVH